MAPDPVQPKPRSGGPAARTKVRSDRHPTPWRGEPSHATKARDFGEQGQLSSAETRVCPTKTSLALHPIGRECEENRRAASAGSFFNLGSPARRVYCV